MQPVSSQPFRRDAVDSVVASIYEGIEKPFSLSQLCAVFKTSSGASLILC